MRDSTEKLPLSFHCRDERIAWNGERIDSAVFAHGSTRAFYQCSVASGLVYTARMRLGKFLSLCLCSILLLECSGCAGVTLATAGTLLGSTGAAISAGGDVYNLGKLDFSVMATFDECRPAALGAIADLGLHIQATEFVCKGKDEIVFKVQDDRRKAIDISIDRRTGKLCQCRVDVGFFGSEPTAKLIVDRFRDHLAKSKGAAVVESTSRKSP